ncbi:Inactive heparanase-2, partial [Goodea atripinnis]
VVRSDIALDKQKGCKLAHHPDIMLELQREKAATTQLVLLKEQLSNIYSNITITAYGWLDCVGPCQRPSITRCPAELQIHSTAFSP